MREHSDIPVSNALRELGCSPVWQLAARNRRLHRVCGELLACLGNVNSKPFPQNCKKCNLLVDNLAVHLLCLCVVERFLIRNPSYGVSLSTTKEHLIRLTEMLYGLNS